MKRYLIILALLIMALTACQKDDVEPIGLGNYDINMCDGSTTLRNGKTYHFYDSGGPEYYYSDDEDYYYTFWAPQGKRVKMQFESFSTEANFDKLYINGTEYSGYNNPGTIYSTYSTWDSLGSFISIRFHSDGSVTYPGWSAIVTAVN